MSRLLRDGEYVVFHNNTYYLSGKKSPNEGMVYIISRNKDEIQNGFIPINVEYNKKYGYFQCRKEVPKSEITEAYEIRTYAKYKGETLDIIGGIPGFLTLSTQYRIPHNAHKEEEEYRNELIKKGFHRGMTEIDGSYWDIIVPIDDPEVELVEKRTEIDVSKL